jgi:hypothetical protein
MPLHRVTHVVVPRYALTDFLFERMHAIDDIKLIEHPLPRRRKLGGLLRALDVYALPWLKHSFYFDKSYTEQLARIPAEDTVLFFAIENRKDLQIIRKYIRARQQFVWLWNPIEVFRKSALSRLFYWTWIRRSGMQAFTFNPADAREGGIRLANQVYRQVDASDLSAVGQSSTPHDVYFIGMDKGRLPELQGLRTELESADLTTHFRIFADKRKHYSDADRLQLTSEWLPYKDNLVIVRDSRALLELLQSTQDGPTIRSMEAAFFGKKLITNNQGMRQSPLYHPSRIFILGQDDLGNLKDFMSSPMEPVPPSVLQAHDIEHWIWQFTD